MKTFFRISVFFAFVLFSSCSGKKKAVPQNDSVKKDSAVSSAAVNGIKITQTDSGKLVSTPLPDQHEMKVDFFALDGKLKSSGFLFSGHPEGAWVNYNDSGKAVQVDYYLNGKFLFHPDKNDFDFREYENAKLGIRFDVPVAWTNSPSAGMDSTFTVSFSKKQARDAAGNMPVIIFSAAQLSAGEDLQRLETDELQSIHATTNHTTIVKQLETTIDSCSAFLLYGTYRDDSGDWGFLNAIIVSENNEWTFSCSAPNDANYSFLRYEGVFRKIVESFEKIK